MRFLWEMSCNPELGLKAVLSPLQTLGAWGWHPYGGPFFSPGGAGCSPAPWLHSRVGLACGQVGEPAWGWHLHSKFPAHAASRGGGGSQTLLPLGQCPESREVPHTASPRHPSLFLHNCCPPGSPPAPSRQCGVSHRRLVVLSGPPSPQPPCHGRGQRMPVPLLQTLADGRDSVRAWQSIPGDLWG